MVVPSYTLETLHETDVETKNTWSLEYDSGLKKNESETPFTCTWNGVLSVCCFES